MSAPKLTIRDWLWSQHCPPEVMADFEKLFSFPNDIRSSVLIAGQSDRIILDSIADALEAILGPEKK